MAVIGWSPVTNAAGDVLGWTAAPDPDEPDVDYFEADRAPKAGRRADHLAPMSDLIGNTAFTAEEVREIMDRSGLSDDDRDAAANVALVLHEVEHGIE